MMWATTSCFISTEHQTRFDEMVETVDWCDSDNNVWSFDSGQCYVNSEFAFTYAPAPTIVSGSRWVWEDEDIGNPNYLDCIDSVQDTFKIYYEGIEEMSDTLYLNCLLANKYQSKNFILKCSSDEFH